MTAPSNVIDPIRLMGSAPHQAPDAAHASFGRICKTAGHDLPSWPPSCVCVPDFRRARSSLGRLPPGFTHSSPGLASIGPIAADFDLYSARSAASWANHGLVCFQSPSSPTWRDDSYAARSCWHCKDGVASRRGVGIGTKLEQVCGRATTQACPIAVKWGRMRFEPHAA